MWRPSDAVRWIVNVPFKNRGTTASPFSNTPALSQFRISRRRRLSCTRFAICPIGRSWSTRSKNFSRSRSTILFTRLNTWQRFLADRFAPSTAHLVTGFLHCTPPPMLRSLQRTNFELQSSSLPRTGCSTPRVGAQGPAPTHIAASEVSTNRHSVVDSFIHLRLPRIFTASSPWLTDTTRHRWLDVQI